MKHILNLLFAATLFALPLSARAQLVSATPAVGGVKLSVGIKLGANLARLNGSDWDAGYKTNLLGGVYVGLRGGKAGIQAEGLFSQSEYTTGSDFNVIYNTYLQNAQDSLSHGHFRVSYFNIPVLLQYKLMQRVWIQAGPQYSGIVSVKDKDAFVKDASSLFKSGTIAGVVGLWINLPMHLNIGGRYILSFTDQKNITSQQASDSWKARDIQIHVGYSF